MAASQQQGASGDVGRDRRKHPRRTRDYEASLFALTGEALLRGHIIDLSKGGAKLIGSPCGGLLVEGRRVRLDAIIGRGDQPEDLCLLQVSSRINRVEASGGESVVAIQFALQLPDVP